MSSLTSRKRKKYAKSGSESTEDSTSPPIEKSSMPASSWKNEDLNLKSVSFASENVEIETLKE